MTSTKTHGRMTSFLVVNCKSRLPELYIPQHTMGRVPGTCCRHQTTRVSSGFLRTCASRLPSTRSAIARRVSRIPLPTCGDRTTLSSATSAQGSRYRLVRPNRRGPVPVYRSSLAGNRSVPVKFKFEFKFHSSTGSYRYTGRFDRFTCRFDRFTGRFK